MAKRQQTDEEPILYTFSDLNIYIVKDQDLKQFLGDQTLMDHYQDWMHGRIYSKDYILNALKNKMYSVELNRAFYLVKHYGKTRHVFINQNAFYPITIEDLQLLKEQAQTFAAERTRNFTYLKHIQKLDKLLEKAESGKLDGKVLLLSTW